MAQGIELVLGWPFRQWDRLADLNLPPYKTSSRPMLHLAIFGQEAQHEEEDDDPEEAMNVHDAFRPVLEARNEALKQFHHTALAEMGFDLNEQGGVPVRLAGRYVAARTPQGVREFSPFRLELFYDPGEMGDDAEAAVIGVAITGRYFPTFADWRSPSGCLSPMIFDAELHHVMDIARKHITAAVPCLKDAPWVVKEIHY